MEHYSPCTPQAHPAAFQTHAHGCVHPQSQPAACQAQAHRMEQKSRPCARTRHAPTCVRGSITRPH
jgi:hypothetical protein